MGFSFNFFGDSEHRVFNYKPRYYDPEKEERRRIFGDVDGSKDADDPKKEGEKYTPGKYIQGSFRDGNYQKTRSYGKHTRLIGIVGLVLFFVILYYVAKFYNFLLQ